MATFACVDCNACCLRPIKGPKPSYCKPCRKQRALLASRKWIEQNKDRKKAVTAEWRRKNPTRVQANKKRFRDQHRQRLAENQRRWIATNGGYVKRMNLRKYGLSVEAFDALYEQQSGRCAVCTVEMRKGAVGKAGCCVDHCHETGRVRGLLCVNCNLGLGHFQDRPELLRSAAEYLGKP